MSLPRPAGKLRSSQMKFFEGDFKGNVGLPSLSGLLLALSMPALPMGFLAWIALIPLLLSLENCSLKDAFRRGAVFSLVFNMLTMYFLAFNSGASLFIAIASYLGLVVYATIFGMLSVIPVALVFRRHGMWGALSFPFFAAAFEYLRSLGEIGWPWNILPLSQSSYLAPMQIASLTGVWGLSFWVAGINSLIFIGLRKNRLWWIGACVWITALFIFGKIALNNPPAVKMTINAAYVQGNVDPREKWANGLVYNLELYKRLSERLEHSDIIVWPESAIPVYVNINLHSRRTLGKLASQLDSPIFTGALALEEDESGENRWYNSAFLFRAQDNTSERYDKIHLVPFGERVPFQKLIPALGKLNFGQAEFTPGDEYHIFRLKKASFGAMICYESIFPPIARRFIIEGADFLVNITNDAWFEPSAEPYQHALLTRFRAIENRRSIIRVANTGISYIADAQGRFLAFSRQGIEDTAQVELPLYEGNTFYTLHGDIFAKGILIACLIIIILNRLIRCSTIERN